MDYAMSFPNGLPPNTTVVLDSPQSILQPRIVTGKKEDPLPPSVTQNDTKASVPVSKPTPATNAAPTTNVVATPSTPPIIHTHSDSKRSWSSVVSSSNSNSKGVVIGAVEKDTDDNANRLYFLGSINGHKASIMVDSGASGNFINSKFVAEKQIPVHTNRNMSVVLADGSQRNSSQLASNLELQIDEYKDKDINMNVMALSSIDCILGMPWLKQWNPEIDWSRSILRLNYKNRKVTLYSATSIKKPSTKNEVKKFLHLCNHRRKFIRQYEMVAAPLLQLVEDEDPFQWNQEMQDSFEELKSAISFNI